LREGAVVKEINKFLKHVKYSIKQFGLVILLRILLIFKEIFG